MNRFIITTTEIEKKEYRIAALCDARQKLIEVTTESMTGTSVLGNIYIEKSVHLPSCQKRKEKNC